MIGVFLLKTTLPRFTAVPELSKTFKIVFTNVSYPYKIMRHLIFIYLVRY